MIREIPLQPGNAHLSFRVELSGTRVRVRLNWLTRFGYFQAIVSDDADVLVAGVGLHPDMDLLVDVSSIPGRLYVQGAAPTVDNLGRDAKLMYET